MKPIYSFLSKHDYMPVFLIFCFALVIRLFHLSVIPYGFHMDEVANTYVGRFILLNGKDLYGNPWPLLYFDKFGDYPPVIPMYLSGLSSFIFGLNEFAARFPASLIGSLGIFPLFFLIKRFVSQQAAIIGASILAFLPWHIVLSRSSSEGIIGFTVFLVGLWVILKGVTEKKAQLVLYSLVFFVLTYLLYPAFRLIVPIILIPLPFLFGSDKKIKRTLYIVLGVTLLITSIVASTDWGRGRFVQTSLFSNPTDQVVIRNDLLQLSNDEGIDAAITARIFHNKVIGYGQRLVEQYLAYFSPHFLFVKGGLPARYMVSHVGLLYYSFLLVLPFLMLLTKEIRANKLFWYAIVLLYISVLPAAITVDDMPNMHRAVVLILPWVLLVTFSILIALEYIRKLKPALKYMILLGVFGVMGSELLYTGHQYFSHAGSIESFRRTDGNMAMAQFLLSNKNNYEAITVPYADWMPIYYLFTAKNFSDKYIGAFTQGETGFEIKQIDNISFVRKDCPSDSTESIPIRSLIIDRGDCKIIPRYDTVGVIQRRDGTAAFRILGPKKE